MPTYKVINDLQLTLYEAGLVSEKPVVKVVASSSPDPIYFWPDELRPLGEWLIRCADEIGNPGYAAPFGGEQAEREANADDTQIEREMALADMLVLRQELDPDASEYIALPFMGEPITYETDDNINDLGLAPVA